MARSHAAPSRSRGGTSRSSRSNGAGPPNRPATVESRRGDRESVGDVCSTLTGPISVESNVYVAETNSAISSVGASKVRSPSAVSTITSANRPNGDSSHDPMTIRTPACGAETRDVTR